MVLQLDTPRLSLRPMTLGDVGAVRALLVDPDVRRWMSDGCVTSEAVVRAAVLRSLASFRWSGVGLFVVRLREGGAFAGYAGLVPTKLALGGFELGAALWPRHWRQGLAVEACRAVLDDAFARAGLARVLACADAPNFRSLGAIAKLGARPLRNTPGVFGAIRWFTLAPPPRAA